MSLINDPRLTAYALGEMPEGERAEFEALLANDSEAMAEVEAIRAVAGELKHELKGEPTPIERPVVVRSRSPRWHSVVAAAASVAVLGIVGWSLLMPGDHRAHELAMAPLHAGAPATQPAVEVRQRTLASRLSAADARAVSDLTRQSRQLTQQGRYGDSLKIIDQIAAIDPTNDYANGVRSLVENREKQATAAKGLVDLTRADEARAPISGLLAYPGDWPDLTAKRENVNRGYLSAGDDTKVVEAEARFDPDAFRLRSDLAALKSQIAEAESLYGPESRVLRAANERAKGIESALRDATLARERGGATDAAVEATLFKQLPELRFDDVPLVDAVEFLRDTTQANIFVNWSELERNGIAKTSPVTLHEKNIPFKQLLQKVIDSADTQHRLAFTVTEGVIAVSTREDIARIPPREFNTESYARIHDNPFLDALSNPLSTFSVDVDTASYSNVRRYLNARTLPPPDAVRIEELINYFPTNDPPPTDGRPFAVYSEVAGCPWSPTHQLVRVAIKGKEIANAERPVSNLVFLIDVSGSMDEPNKLPLVKQSMRKLLDQLGENDRVAIVVYAGASGLALSSTSAMNKEQIRAAIDELTPGGSTNGAQGIELAYAQAQANFIAGGTNRVILCTDGDFNVGVTDRGQLTRLIEEKAKAGVFLSVLGFGTGNTKDDTMEQLADKGNGNYAYIDTDREAEKVLVKEMSGTLVTIAKDVKLQLEFNPAKVKSYRLIGYENRVLAKEDFNNDLKDAGEIGAGHQVVALYEVEPSRLVTRLDISVANAELEQRRKELVTAKARVVDMMDLIEAGHESDGAKLIQLIREKAESQMRLEESLARSEKMWAELHASTQPTTKSDSTDPLKYQSDPNLTEKAKSDELLTLKLRYKAPDAPLEQGTSQLIEFTLADSDRSMEQTSKDFQFASAVASFGMMLRDSPHKGELSWDQISRLAEQGGGEDRGGYRAEFRRLVDVARSLGK